MQATLVWPNPTGNFVQNWSDPASWENGRVPASSSNLHVKFESPNLLQSDAIEGDSMEDLGIAAAPFHVGTLDFSGIQSRVALFVNGVLFIKHIEGGPNTLIYVSGAAHVSGSVLNEHVDFLKDGSAFYVGKESTGSQFEFINPFSGATNTLIFQRPEENSQASITVDTFMPATAWSDRIELHGLDFDAASMVPGSDKPALTLKGSPVFELDHVHVANAGSSPEPVINTGFDLQTGNHFVSFNGPPSTLPMV